MSWVNPLMYPPPGRAGVDFKEDQLIVRLKHGCLDYPHGQTNVPLYQCDIEDSLWNLLTNSRVVSVNRVFRDCFPGDTVRTVHGETCRVPDLSQVYVLYLQNNVDVLETIEKMYEHKAVLYAEPNHIGAILCSEPNDSLWDDQWNLHTPDDDSAFGIGCPTAWDYTTGDSDIRIAILDDDFDYYHDDLGGGFGEGYKVEGGWDYGDDDDDPYGTKGHGTKCAGIAAALTNNDSVGVAGIAGGWGGANIGAKLYAMKLSGIPFGAFPPIDTVAMAIRESSDPNVFGCDILSCSWIVLDYNETLRAAVVFAYRVGANIVAAKSNDGLNTIRYPADFNDQNWVTSVGGYGPNGARCVFNDNCDYGSNYGGNIDLLAPGTGTYTTKPNNSYEPNFGGTSGATPHVAGAIALLRSVNDTLYNEDYEWMLKFSTWDELSDSNEWTWDEEYGHGDLRISTAVERLASLFDLSSYTTTGGDIADSSTLDTLYFYNLTGDTCVSSGEYPAKRFTISKDITYSQSYIDTPYVWGVGFGSRGWSDSDINYCTGYCEVVELSANEEGCRLQTYIYKLYDPVTLKFLGWFPCEADSVIMKYRVWGDLSGERGWSQSSTQIDFSNQFRVLGNRPNPFNSTTTIEFEIPQDSRVNLTIYDMLGREVKILINENLNRGLHSIEWCGNDNNDRIVSSGIYFLKIKADGISRLSKLSFIK